MTDGFKNRFYKRQKWTLDCEVVTPMFLGNAEQKAEWRSEPFKGLMRFWWRVSQGSLQMEWRELLKHESALFGSAGDDDGKGGKSNVIVRVISQAMPSSDLPKDIKVTHPEINAPIYAMAYLAGQGIINKKKKPHFFPVNSTFTLQIDSPRSETNAMKKVICLIQLFGALGARSRNGWGSFRIIGGGYESQEITQTLQSSEVNDWKTGFTKDYPNSLGKDSIGSLLWKTVPKRKHWNDVMKDLAEAYIELRAGKIKNDPQKLHPEQERPLLGTPITHHINDERYSSPIRLMVRKRGSEYLGFILHLPQQFPNHGSPLAKSMPLKEKQLDIWTNKIHKRLDNMADKLCRASYEDCL